MTCSLVIRVSRRSHCRVFICRTGSLVVHSRLMITVMLLMLRGSSRQVAWINGYHEQVRRTLQPLLVDDKRAMDYLIRETAPLQ
jgi:hypothetical protein